MDAAHDMACALKALYLEAPREVAADVEAKVRARVIELEDALRRAEALVDAAFEEKEKTGKFPFED